MKIKFQRIYIDWGLKENYGHVIINTNITMHMFRHAYAILLYKAGVDIKTAQSYMGYSSITVTMNIYTHLDLRFKEVNASKLNEFCLQKAI